MQNKFNKSKTWIISGLIWGTLMFTIMTFLLPLLEDEPITWKRIVISLPVWLGGGLGWAYSVKWINIQKIIDKQ